MRLINASELIERAWRERLDSRELIVQMIESAPTEVVTCKDCRYAVPLTGNQEQQICQHDIPYPFMGPIVDNDWFCADGKRKVNK